jgi:hypothetical protein
MSFPSIFILHLHKLTLLLNYQTIDSVILHHLKALKVYKANSYRSETIQRKAVNILCSGFRVPELFILSDFAR